MKVVIELAECEKVTGMANERTVSRSPGLWNILGTAMKIKNATGETFAGQTES
jgi:hypothetical protein